MSDLVERTRITCIERVREARDVLRAKDRPDGEVIEAALRGLHAIKGETAMVGLRKVSTIAHVLESLLVARRSQPNPDVGDVRDALRVLTEILTSTPAAALEDAEDLDYLLAELGASLPDVAPATGFTRAERSREASGGAGDEARRELVKADRRWARVDSRRIEELSSSISEIATEVEGVRAALRALGGKDERTFSRALAEIDHALASLWSRAGSAEERAFALRLVPVSPLLEELAEHVEGLAERLGKQVRVRLEAQGVALERAVVDALREPLLHLARNAIDHGIEPATARVDKDPVGTVVFAAEASGEEVVISVEDDGAGLDSAALRRRGVELGILSSEEAARLSEDEACELVFADGFSQREVADDLSGRGVGLAAVRRSTEDLGGAARVVRGRGGGTRFELVLPSAVARERVLVVEEAGLLWAIPSRWVLSVVREGRLVEEARRTGRLRTPEGLVMSRPLHGWLGSERGEVSQAVVVEIAERRVALLVPRVLAEKDILRRPAEPVLAVGARIAGSGALPGGRPVFFLRWAEVLREIVRFDDRGAPETRRMPRRSRVLVADDSPIIREIVGDVLAREGVEVTLAEDGKIALECLERGEFDLVISDVEMPRLNGLELLTAIRKRSSTLPVVMLTTRSTTQHRREAAALGANAYIAKSEFQGDTLLEVVNRFVSLAS